MNKKFSTVTISVDSNMDADDYGQRIVDCVSHCNPELEFINLIKVDLGEARISMDTLGGLMRNLKDMFIEAGATNCIFVPIGEYIGVRDIKIDSIKVVEDNDVADEEKIK